MKATSLFGGVQAFTILISILRTKFVAVLLGPTGMGISGLLNATINLISGLTNFGLGTSAVKNISAANRAGNEVQISRVVIVIRRLVWITGLLGAIVTLLFSPWLSELTFNNKNYTFAFVWISITLLLNQISIGQNVVLRGMRKLQYMAKASMIGNILGLIITIPLYYLYGIKGIVPGIIATSLSTLLLTWFYARKIKLTPVTVSKIRTIVEGKGILQMGFLISISSLISMGGGYIVRIFISNIGGIDQVGLYNAGFAIINSYVGMIFTAMSTDYYPRLATVAENNIESRSVIIQQAEIALLILAPVLIIFLVCINWVIILLYSKKFIGINDMMLWAAIGIFFKAASWSISFVFLAKGATKSYFWNEFIFNLYLLSFNIIGYFFWGLTGLGISFLVAYIIYLLQVYYIAKKKYAFSFSKEFYKIFGLQLLLAIICLCIVKIFSNPYSYIFGAIIICASIIHSYIEMDKKMNLKSIIAKLVNRVK